MVNASEELIDPLGHISKLLSFSGEGNVTSITEESCQGTEIRTGLQDLRNSFSYCINIYRVPNVDKALGDTERSLACPFPQGVSSYNINNKKIESVKCHKRCTGEVLGSVRNEEKAIYLSSVALLLTPFSCGSS